ncbi:hypothetical protein JCM5350_005231 [Sporobolomyces pararoseus]
MARNSDVSPYIGKLSRSKVYAKKGLYKRQPKSAAPAEGAAAKAEEPAYYPGDDVRQPKVSRKSNKPTKLRSSIVPGTVVILLAGRFRGKRVVVLGQLPSGLLLVTGPFKINGVPLRRVNQAYVIATSTKVDLGSFQLDAKFNDAYFSKEKTAKRSGTEGEFFKDGEKEKKAFPAEKAADQKSVDKAIIAAVAGVPNLSKYLSATFGLTKGQYPHLLKFNSRSRLNRQIDMESLEDAAVFSLEELQDSTHANRSRAGEEDLSRSIDSTSLDSRPSLSTFPSFSTSLSSASTLLDCDLKSNKSKWPSGGFEPSWMETSEENFSLSTVDSRESLIDFTFASEFLIGPRQEFTPVPRQPLEPLLPERFNSPSVFLDPTRTGYKIESIALGTLNDRTFHEFLVERHVVIDNGRIALQSGGGGGGGIDISGYGFEHSAAFHLKFVPGSVQALYFLRDSSSESDSNDDDAVEKVTLIVSTLQTPIFRASLSSRGDFEETSTARVSGLDSEHYRVVPYLSKYYLVQLSFATNEIFNPHEPLPSTFENFLFDLDQLDNFPSPTYLDPNTVSLEQNTTSEYSRSILAELSASFGGFDSPSLAFPLEWNIYDGTLTPSEVLLLIEDHVKAWEVTADYDEEIVEEILYELRTTLVEKRQARFDAIKRGESFEDNKKRRFEGVEREAELARQRVLERKKGIEGEGGDGLLQAGEAKLSRRPHRKGKGKVTLEERGKKNLYWARGVVVTPSGSVRIQGKSIEKTNSIIRSNFDGVDHFLRVSFKEEDGLTLSTIGGLEARAQHELFDGTITRILKNGLVLGGRRFELLSYSQASLRDAAAVFLAPFPSSVVQNGIRQTRLIDARQIRSSMGHFDKVSHQPAMLGARWSQSFTTTSGSVVVRDHQIHSIDDISEFDERGKEVTCHTDGAGLLSPKLRDSICETLISNGYRLSSTAPFPSVFQFRLGGHKGILVVDNTQEGIGIAVRPSQEKFFGVAENDEGDSFVLNIAEAFDRPRPLKLNRPLISALQDLGIPAEAFLRYQREAVESLELPKDDRIFRTAHLQLVSASLGGPSGFQQLLKSFAQIDSLPPSLLLDEPFLRQALDVVRIRVLRAYKYHASIPLPDCYLLVGVPDEDGILEEDQVYIALRDPQEHDTVQYLQGRIAITRSPTVDAGDVRIVNAIGKYEGRSRLTSLENCVVLPTKGKRSLCSMMGGGDLDGDTYQIITLPDLIPKTMFPPASHTAKPPLTFDRPATIEDVADCFVHYLENNLVGAIATKHLFVSDKSPQHGRDPIAIKLADLHSHSVDSPKTGQVVRNDDLPRFPDYLKRERPDFLQPENRNGAFESGYYPSERALGQLYRDIDYEQIKMPQEILEPPPLDHHFQSPEGHSTGFRALRSVVDEKVTKLLEISLDSLNINSQALRSSNLKLRDSFCTHLRDLAAVHSFPRTGGQRLSEVEIFASTNLAISTRDTVARGNAVVAMGTQLDSLVEWLKRQLGSGVEGIKKMRAAWVLGLDQTGEEEKGEWKYGMRSFGWICLSILLENLLRMERESKKENKTVEAEQNEQKEGIKRERARENSVDTIQGTPLDDEPLATTSTTIEPVAVVASPSPSTQSSPKAVLQPSAPTFIPRSQSAPPLPLSSRPPKPSTQFLQRLIRPSPSPSPSPSTPQPQLPLVRPPRLTNSTRPTLQPFSTAPTLKLLPQSLPKKNKEKQTSAGGGGVGGDPWQTELLIRSTYFHHLYPQSHSPSLPSSSSSSRTVDTGSRRRNVKFGPERGPSALTLLEKENRILRKKEKVKDLRKGKGKINVESDDLDSSTDEGEVDSEVGEEIEVEREEEEEGGNESLEKKVMKNEENRGWKGGWETTEGTNGTTTGRNTKAGRREMQGRGKWRKW